MYIVKYYNCIKDMLKNVKNFNNFWHVIFIMLVNMFLLGVLRMKLKLKYAFYT
jgi:hypothetical protein